MNNADVTQSPNITEMLRQLSFVHKELREANRDLVDALGRSESAERIADFEQRVALLNELADSLASKISVLAEAQLLEGPR